MAMAESKYKQNNATKSEFGFKQLIQIKYLLLFLLLITVCYTYLNWQNWLEKLDNKPISAFALTGTPQFTRHSDIKEQIFDNVQQRGFFTQDVDIVRKQIESIPWIKSATVRKIWPDRLSISVTEHIPIAYWNKNELVSSEGVIFKLPFNRLKSDDMPRLFGDPHKSSTLLKVWDKMYQDFKSKQLNLKILSLDERGAWEVTLDSGIILRLGRGEWKDKIDRFVTIYPQIEVPDHQKIDYVDLRYSVGAAVNFTKAK